MPTTRSLLIDIEERKRGNALAGAANDMDKLAAEVDKTDNKFKRFAQDTKRVNAEIDKSTAKIKDLRQQAARTGDTGLFGDLRKEEARLRNLRNLLKGIENDFKAGTTAVTNNFGQQLSGAFGQVPVGPIAIGAITAVVAAAAPMIGAMIAGATVGAVGTGGLVGGVLAASHDQRVKDAFAALLNNVKDEFFGAGSSFVEPLLRSTAILDKAFRDLSLGPLFAEIAPQLEVIVQGFADLVAKALPGLNNLFARSGAFADVAAKGLGYLGESLGVFLDEISKSPGALEGLEMLFTSLGEAIKALGGILEFLADVMHNTIKVMATLTDVTAGFAAALGANGLSQWLIDNARQLHNFANEADAANSKLAYAKDVTSAVGRAFTAQEIATNNATQALARENDELKNTIDLIDQALGISLNLDQANLALQRGLMDFNKVLQENGAQWNKNTEAGLQEREMILGLIADAGRIRDAQIKAGESVKDANAAYDQQVSALLNLAKQAGATEDQLVALQGTYRIDVQINWLFGAITSTLSKIGAAIPHFASGGVMPGATGSPGLAVLHGGERVLTPGQQAASTAPVVLQIAPGSGGSGLDQLFWTWFAKYVQVQGGGNVQLAITGRTA